ncbi:MAG: hypothetical protein P4L79_10655 [Legionella sp.]|uniref:hypothetical protein n=1 Tax=Legionella sp. TaxID=459 RepID=UPI00285168DD|nr:hypothetical protein [Legionella sp.]
MSEFKIGDLVEFVEDYGFDARCGDQGVVVETKRTKDFDDIDATQLVSVKITARGTRVVHAYDKRMKLVEPKEKVFAVFETTKDGEYTTGVVEKFATYEEALDVAKQMATMEHECKYSVTELIAVVESETPKVNIILF